MLNNEQKIVRQDRSDTEETSFGTGKRSTIYVFGDYRSP